MHNYFNIVTLSLFVNVSLHAMEASPSTQFKLNFEHYGVMYGELADYDCVTAVVAAGNKMRATCLNGTVRIYEDDTDRCLKEFISTMQHKYVLQATDNILIYKEYQNILNQGLRESNGWKAYTLEAETAKVRNQVNKGK